MAIPPLAIGLLLAAAPVPPSAFAETDNWWDCEYALPPTGGGTWGHLYRRFTLDGEGGHSSYNLWGPELRAYGRVVDTPRGARPWVSSLSVEYPATPFSRTGGAVHGDLLGDGALVATTIIIDAREARRGFSVANVYFWERRAGELGPALAAADRWTIVIRQADGTELRRRDLSVPDRRARDDLFARHWAALQEAWRARDPNPNVAPPPGSARCRLSTPETREEERAQQERAVE